MQESVIHQELREEARADVRQELREEAQLEGQRSLILHQRVPGVGALPSAVRSHVEALSLTQLESRGDASLAFSNLSDLETWLAEHSAA